MKNQGTILDCPQEQSELVGDGMTKKSKPKSNGSISLALKRMRHQCIAISEISDKNDKQVSNKTSQLSLEIPIVKLRSMSVTDAGEAVSTNVPIKPSLTMQRSLSLHEFSEDALPVNMSHDIVPNTIKSPTPPKSPRPNGILTRRSSFVQGTVFIPNDFIIGETLGFGFFGKAVKVTHRGTGDCMVMKELINCDDEGKKTFLKEAAVLRGLSHPKLLKYIGFLYKGKNLHIITEYIPGGTLEKLIHTSSHRLPVTKQIKIGLDIASAMEYLHSQQVIHRDLNSPNCLLREDESVVVSDFGLSRLILDSQNAVNLLHKQNGDGSPKPHRIKKKRYTVVGNPYWMAPEMLKGEHYDEKVDVFSFGIILCEVIGQVNADPDYLPRLANFSVDKEAFISQFCKECPDNVISLVFECCQLNSDARPSFEVIHKKLLELFMNHAALERKILKAAQAS